MEPEGSLPYPQVPATCPYPVPDESSPYPRILLPEHQSYYPPIYVWVSQVVSFPQVSPPKPCTSLSSPPHVLHAPPISIFSILSPEQYLVSSTDHSTPQYSLLHLSGIKAIFADFKTKEYGTSIFVGCSNVKNSTVWNRSYKSQSGQFVLQSAVSFLVTIRSFYRTRKLQTDTQTILTMCKWTRPVGAQWCVLWRNALHNKLNVICAIKRYAVKTCGGLQRYSSTCSYPWH